MTYAELVTMLQEYLLNDESTFVSNIPNIVKSAEEDIYSNTQIPELRRASTGSLTSGNRFLSLPADFLSTYSFSVVNNSTHYTLLNKEVDLMREAFPDPTDTGQPRYYALHDNDTFIVSPTPDANYTVELNYFYKPDSIVVTNTSWLGDFAPNALLYGSCVHGYLYMKGTPDLMNEYRNEYLRALANLQIITEGRMRKDTYRSMNIRQPL